MKEDKFYLQHVMEAVSNIENFIGKMAMDDFLKNNLIQSAVIRQLEIIGEAVKNLSPSLKRAHNNMPWKEIAGLRDKLIHVYFGVDLHLVWTVCMREIPELKKMILRILNKP